MGVYVTNGKNLMLERLRLIATHASLHTAAPDSSGSSEATGGSYARVAVSIGAAASGSMAHGALTWNVPAGTFTHVGYWSALTAGTFYAYDDLDTAQTFSSAGTLTIDSGTLDLSLA